MTNIHKFPGTAGKSGDFAAEATPCGINFVEKNADGLYQHTRMLGYSGAIRQLDNGAFDDDLPRGMYVVAELWAAERKGYFTPSSEQAALIWRWVVACLFILEQKDRNGTRDVPSEGGGYDRAAVYVGESGGLCVYPASERCSLANHVEGLALEKYGAGEGFLMAVRLYQTMVEVKPGKGMTLSETGREGLAMLHDGFINMLNNGDLPDEPVTH